MTNYQIKARILKLVLGAVCCGCIGALLLMAATPDAKAANMEDDIKSNWITVEGIVLCFLIPLFWYFYAASQRQARHVRNAYLQFMGSHEAAMPVREKHRISSLWSAWNNCVRSVANVCRVLRGHGCATGRDDHRAQGVKWQLRAVKLQVGDNYRASQQQEKQSCSRMGWRVPHNRPMGGEAWDKSTTDRQAHTSRMDGGAGFDDANRVTGEGPPNRSLDKNSLPTNNAYAQRRNKEHHGLGFIAWIRQFVGTWKAIASWSIFGCCAIAAQAEAAPDQVARWSNIVSREAQTVYGPDAPVPMFLGQIRQESSGDEKVTAFDGGAGLAQMMPNTIKQLSGLFPELGPANPYDPRWAIRAMVRYDGWIYKRVKGDTDCDKWAASLKSYNAGLGYAQRAQKISPSPGKWFGATENINVGQSAKNFEYSRQYPRWILYKHQARYSSFGRRVCPLDVVPITTSSNMADQTFADAILDSQSKIGFVGSEYGVNLLQIQLGPHMAFSPDSSLPVLTDHIGHVVRIGPEEKMLRVDACRCVASVAYEQTIGDRTVSNFVCNPVRESGLLIHLQNAITLWADAANPQSATRLGCDGFNRQLFGNRDTT